MSYRQPELTTGSMPSEHTKGTVGARLQGMVRPERMWRALWIVFGMMATVLWVGCSADAAGTASSTSQPSAPDTSIPPVVATAPAATSPVQPPDSTRAPVCEPAPAGDHAEAPSTLRVAIADALTHPGFADVELSAVIWSAAYGTVLAAEPDLALFPASNQKLFTAIGAELLLDAEQRFSTEVYRDAEGRLVLVAGGDPTLAAVGPHSLAALAEQLVDVGVTESAGLIIDVSMFEAATMAPGWLDWQMPTYVGPMSAFMVDDNDHRADAAYVAEPARGNAELFRSELEAVGMDIDGPTEVHHEPVAVVGEPLARLESAPVSDLLGSMLLSSDNEMAESLVRRIGSGSTSAGTAAIESALEPWCLSLNGTAADGSGLSRGNLRSSAEWVALLRSAQAQPWGAELRAWLPVSGESGTLARRLSGVSGSVSAKTGSIIGGRALSGYAVTDAGTDVVFSIITNGDAEAAASSRAAIDGLITAVVRHG